MNSLGWKQRGGNHIWMAFCCRWVAVLWRYGPPRGWAWGQVSSLQCWRSSHRNLLRARGSKTETKARKHIKGQRRPAASGPLMQCPWSNGDDGIEKRKSVGYFFKCHCLINRILVPNRRKCWYLGSLWLPLRQELQETEKVWAFPVLKQELHWSRWDKASPADLTLHAATGLYKWPSS